LLFSWDDSKNRINQRKHGISFEMAMRVFDDPLHLSRQDREEHGELRWQTIGVVENVMLLLVAHTSDHAETGEEHIRLISARRVTKLERKIYEQAH
jgi:uncharacterized DUF497 family protein